MQYTPFFMECQKCNVCKRKYKISFFHQFLYFPFIYFLFYFHPILLLSFFIIVQAEIYSNKQEMSIFVNLNPFFSFVHSNILFCKTIQFGAGYCFKQICSFFRKGKKKIFIEELETKKNSGNDIKYSSYLDAG